MNIDIEEMLDSSEFSNESENGGWSRRGVESLVKDCKCFHTEIFNIRTYLQKIRKKQQDLTVTASVLSAVGSSLTAIELSKEIVSLMNKTNVVDSTFTLTILVFAFVIDICATICLLYLKAQNIDEEIQVGSECLQEYQYLCDEVESQLLRKSKYRSNMVEFMKRIHHTKEKLYYVQSTKLGMSGKKEMNIDVEDGLSSYSTCSE